MSSVWVRALPFFVITETIKSLLHLRSAGVEISSKPQTSRGYNVSMFQMWILDPIAADLDRTTSFGTVEKITAVLDTARIAAGCCGIPVVEFTVNLCPYIVIVVMDDKRAVLALRSQIGGFHCPVLLGGLTAVLMTIITEARSGICGKRILSRITSCTTGMAAHEFRRVTDCFCNLRRFFRAGDVLCAGALAPLNLGTYGNMPVTFFAGSGVFRCDCHCPVLLLGLTASFFGAFTPRWQGQKSQITW
jgi:hypothetical protein